MSTVLARRPLLKAVASSLLFGLSSSLVGCGDGSAAAAPAAEPAATTADGPLDVLAAAFFQSQLDNAQIIGRRYLALTAPDADNEALWALLAPTVTLASSHSDVAEAVALVRAKVASDFTAGNIANVDGWQLSLTEAQMCAIASLESK